jgi:heme-degrading monooxygenase HmoA
MSLVTVTVLQFPPGQRYRAFANMGRWLMNPFDTPGLSFQKMMGTGKNFGLWPDFSRYVFVGVWKTEAEAQHFFATEQWRSFLPRNTDSAENQTGTLYLQPIKSHGLWDGVDPFTPSSIGPGPNEPVAPAGNAPIAVLTRASIRTGALVDFWRNVPEARKRIDEQGDNLLLALGAGEKPLVQQCTISVWRNAALVDQFAYRQSGHREIVKKTRQRKWYSEELFARFTVLKMEGF